MRVMLYEYEIFNDKTSDEENIPTMMALVKKLENSSNGCHNIYILTALTYA